MSGFGLSRTRFALLFSVMLVAAAGNTAMQSLLPAIGRVLQLSDMWVALAFTLSAVLWVVAAPYWAHRADSRGRRALMRLGRRRHGSGAGVVGRARVGKRTKDLTKRLEPGDIAVIDHADIDRVAADGLIDAGVVAVVNAAASITGRYPNGGPMRLVSAGVLLVDDVGSSIMDAVLDGQQIRLDGGVVAQ